MNVQILRIVSFGAKGGRSGGSGTVNLFMIPTTIDLFWLFILVLGVQKVYLG